MAYIQKSVTIRPDQQEWLQKTPLNLSKLLQRAIDEVMKPTELSLGGGA